MKRFLIPVILPALLAGWTSCTTSEPPMPEPRTLVKTAPEYKNPFDPSCYAHFVARKDYVKTYDVFQDKTLLARQPKGSHSIYICLNDQRGQYLVDGLVAMDFPISSGIKSFPTKTGNYKVLHKEEDHDSNLYGKMYDADGKCINADAYPTDEVPEGGRYVPSPMPYWQRLTWAGLGLHVGKVRRKPASHGCVRLPRNVAKTLYEQTSVGSRVTIKDEYLPVPEAQRVRAKK